MSDTAQPMEFTRPPPELVDRLRGASNVTIITGAGMSAESGVPTFRDASEGLWAKFDPYALASPSGWKEDRSRVWAWYEWRRGLVSRTVPNAGHYAIAHLAESSTRNEGNEDKLTLITQNVDDLHERAGSLDALHVHGSLFAPRCSACGRQSQFATEPPKEPIEHIAPPRCGHCGGYVRPGVVWFGEDLPTGLWHHAVRSARGCDVLLVVGTSGVVRPISDLPRLARENGVWVCEINPRATEVSKYANISWQVTAAIGLPQLVAARTISGG